MKQLPSCWAVQRSGCVTRPGLSFCRVICTPGNALHTAGAKQWLGGHRAPPPPSKALNSRGSEQKSPAVRPLCPSVGPVRSWGPERGGDVPRTHSKVLRTQAALPLHLCSAASFSTRLLLLKSVSTAQPSEKRSLTSAQGSVVCRRYKLWVDVIRRKKGLRGSGSPPRGARVTGGGHCGTGCFETTCEAARRVRFSSCSQVLSRAPGRVSTGCVAAWWAARGY